VAFGPLNLGRSRAEARRIALECLARVGLEEAADRVPHHLSFGERKRVCLAGVLACRPSVLALDEPTANLDVRAEAAFFDRFLELTEGLTTILISHRFSTVRRAERIVVLEEGHVIETGTHAELIAHGGRYAELFHLQASRFES
jgi:energy-coupling factor transporter ATP-binding protein EcfA2